MSNYSEDIAVDIHALDFEWERQASLILKYSTLYADSATLRDEAKEELSRIDGELDLEIRNSPEEYGFESKPTEAGIRSVILNTDRHIEAAKELTRLNREVLIFQGIKSSLDHKKAALERLTSLYLSGYWADPKIRGEAKSAYETENVQEAQRSHLANNSRIGGKHGKNK